jgi:hypothetical protein
MHRAIYIPLAFALALTAIPLFAGSKSLMPLEWSLV